MKDRIKVVMIFLSLVLLVSVIYSKYVLSLSMFGFFFLSLYHKEGTFRFWKDKSYLMISLLFFLFLISGINSTNLAEWLHHLKMRLPFLALPVVFFKLPAWNRKELVGIHLFLIALLLISTIPVTYRIIVDFEVVYEDIARGRPIQTPVNHVKYSIFIAYAILSGWIIYLKESPLKYLWERKVILAMVIYLVIFLHVLAVRSGIAVFYIAVLITGIIYAYRSRSFRYLGIALSVVVVLPFVAYKTIPSLNKRVHYMIYDINEYLKNGGSNYSDSDRINSILVGVSIVRDNPLWGVGIGDIRDVCILRYQETFGDTKKVLYPHNQYLFITAATGMVGLLVFLIAFWGPLFKNNNHEEDLLLILLIIFGSGFLVDNLMERSFSAAFLAFFYASILSYRKNLSSQ